MIVKVFFSFFFFLLMGMRAELSVSILGVDSLSALTSRGNQIVLHDCWKNLIHNIHNLCFSLHTMMRYVSPAAFRHLSPRWVEECITRDFPVPLPLSSLLGINPPPFLLPFLSILFRFSPLAFIVYSHISLSLCSCTFRKSSSDTG